MVKTETGLQIKDTSGRAIVLAVICDRPADMLAGGPPPTPFFMVRNRPAAPILEKARLDALPVAGKAHLYDLSEADKAKYIAYWHEAMKEASRPKVQSSLK